MAPDEPSASVLRVLGLHGVGDHHTDQSWKVDWEAAIKSAVADWDPSITVVVDLPIFDQLFDEKRFPLNPISYSSALAQLSASGIGVGIENVEHKIGEVIGGIGSAIGGLFHPSRGLADIPNELRWTAGMIAQWADYSALRQACRDWLAQQLAVDNYDLVIAHSLGTLVSYDTFLHHQALLNEAMTFGVFGSQVGNPFIRGCFGGRLMPLIGPRKWFQLFNSNDRVFTARISLPDDPNFQRVETPFIDGWISHDAVKYLTHPNAIDSLWQDVVAAKTPSRAFRTIPASLELFRETMSTALRDRPLPRGRRRVGPAAKLPPNRRALLVGINEYPDPQNRLEGCVNDVFQISAALQESGFDAEDIRCVFDDRATTSGILDRLQWLLSGTRDGDERVFFYSGHGAQIAGYGPSMEPDHLNECLVPYDFDWSEAHAITDKHFVDLYSQLPFGCQFATILDCCHSGGMSRDGGAKVRGLTPPDDIRHRALRWDAGDEMWVARDFKPITSDRDVLKTDQRARAFVGESRAKFRLGRAASLRLLSGAKKTSQRKAIKSEGPFMPTIFEACGEDELAYEYRHGVTSYGAFTFSMTKELREARRVKRPAKVSFNDLLKRTTARLHRLKYDQTPCLVGPAERLKDPIPWHPLTGPGEPLR